MEYDLPHRGWTRHRSAQIFRSRLPPEPSTDLAVRRSAALYGPARGGPAASQAHRPGVPRAFPGLCLPGLPIPGFCRAHRQSHVNPRAWALDRQAAASVTRRALPPKYLDGTTPRGFRRGALWGKGVQSRVARVPELVLSDHAARRCQQRGIRPEDLWVALRAKATYSHGCLVYRVTDRLLARLGIHTRADRLRGLTVVVDTSGVVRTVKWDFRLRKSGPLRRSRQLFNGVARGPEERRVA